MLLVSLLLVLQIQEFRTGATRQNMESLHAKEECKRLRATVGESRDKLADLDAKVSFSQNVAYSSICITCGRFRYVFPLNLYVTFLCHASSSLSRLYLYFCVSYYS